ncbi:hypothetical protein HY627_00345 [Candidatus Uhrbacteria bacterium]|nr:hypothetical protein [Candidatus Uhrbacteria bacterium]
MVMSKCTSGTITIEAVIAFGIFMLSIGSIVLIPFGSERLFIESETALATLNARDAIAPPNPSSLPGNALCSTLATDNRALAVRGSLTVSSLQRGTGIGVRGRYVYLSTDSTIASDPDLFVVDVSNPDAPWIAATLDTGPGIAAIALADNYLYAANTSRTGQLQIISIQNPSHPNFISQMRMPSVTGTGAQGVGTAIAIKNRIVFVGLSKTATGPELHIIDASDPSHPLALSSVPAGTKINAIGIHGTRAYIATPTSDQLRVIDVSDARHPILSTTFRPNDSASNNGQSVALAGSVAYFGRNASATASASSSQLFLLDTQSSSTLPEQASVSINASVFAIAEHTGRLLLGTNNAARSLQLWGTASSSEPLLLSSIALAAPPRAIACDDDFIYLALDSNRAFSIISLNP